MITDVVTAIAKIADRINESKSMDEVLDSINSEKKYDKKTWAAAYSWIFDKHLKTGKNRKVNIDLIKASGFRVLSESEKNLIGLENLDYLLNFYHARILDKEDIEKVIEQLKIIPEERVNIDSINVLIFSLFYNIEAESLPGSRRLLHTSDTIN